jgi:hypothetical protein
MSIEVGFQVADKLAIDFLERNVAQIVFVLKKIGDLPANSEITVIIRLADINAYQVFAFPVMVVEQFKQGLMLLFDTQKDIFDFFGGNVVIPLLQLTIYPVYRRFGVVDKRIDPDGGSRPSGRLARFHVPALGTHIAFHTETHFLTVHRDAAVERNHPVGFLFVSF